MPNRSLTRIGGMIAAAQHGFSKKSGKPYSMVTLEDLEGSVQLLVMNEITKNSARCSKSIRRSSSSAKSAPAKTSPKIFPQEIMPLADAPKKYTKQVHLRLNTAHLQPEDLTNIGQLLAAHPGKCPVFLCFMLPGGEMVFIQDTNERFNVTPSLELQHAVNKRVGEKTYYAKVDTSLPERTPRRWERKPEASGEE